jgi:hypothetical protein
LTKIRGQATPHAYAKIWTPTPIMHILVSRSLH